MIKKHVKRAASNKHIRELVIYGIVGIAALVIQDIIYWAGHRYWGIYPTVAMMLGTTVGMFVSYFGHTKFTFQKTHRFSHSEFVKFAVTAGVGLVINAGGVRVITKVFMMSPEWGLLPTFIAPIITFVISKFWAFK